MFSKNTARIAQETTILIEEFRQSPFPPSIKRALDSIHDYHRQLSVLENFGEDEETNGCSAEFIPGIRKNLADYDKHLNHYRITDDASALMYCRRVQELCDKWLENEKAIQAFADKTRDNFVIDEVLESIY